MRKFLLDQDSPLSAGTLYIIDYLNKELRDDLQHYKVVTLEQVFFALNQQDQRGILCIRVFKELERVGNRTPVSTVMKGLLTPLEHRSVEAISLAKAEQELKTFLKDVEFLSIVIKRGKIQASVIKKYEGSTMRSIVDNLAEFKAAKERLEDVQSKVGKEDFADE